MAPTFLVCFIFLNVNMLVSEVKKKKKNRKGKK